MVYVFDGTKNGFLTAFLAAYKDENALLTSKQTQVPVGERTLFIDTEPLRAEKAKNRLLCFDRDCMRDFDTLLRSGMDNNEQIAFRYFHTLTKEKRPIGKMLSNPDVFAAVECMRKVGFEVHRFHGFIRFMETASGALYATYSHRIFGQDCHSFLSYCTTPNEKKPPCTTERTFFSRRFATRKLCSLPTRTRGRRCGKGITPPSISPLGNDCDKCVAICPRGIGNSCPKSKTRQPTNKNKR